MFSIPDMWKSLIKTSSILPRTIFRRFQSSNQYYQVNDDIYGLTDDQKQVRRKKCVLL